MVKFQDPSSKFQIPGSIIDSANAVNGLMDGGAGLDRR
jgi:hypothetical protein